MAQTILSHFLANCCQLAGEYRRCELLKIGTATSCRPFGRPCDSPGIAPIQECACGFRHPGSACWKCKLCITKFEIHLVARIFRVFGSSWTVEACKPRRLPEGCRLLFFYPQPRLREGLPLQIARKVAAPECSIRASDLGATEIRELLNLKIEFGIEFNKFISCLPRPAAWTAPEPRTFTMAACLDGRSSAESN